MYGLKIYFKRLDKRVHTPTYSHEGDACCDIYVIENYTIKPGDRCMARTGFAISIPDGFEGQLRPRSGLSSKLGLTVINSPGTIDSGYRGEIFVPLVNHGKEKVSIKAGDRVAQMKFSRVYTGYFLDIGDEELDDTDRGIDGIGSTGL